MEPTPDVVKAGFSKRLVDCDLRIQSAYPLVREQFVAEHPDHDLHVDYTYRSPALQFELFKKGRKLDIASGQWVLVDRAEKVTDKDGVMTKSAHNYFPARGADIYITRGGNILWGVGTEEQGLYIVLGRIWESYHVISGATWLFAWKDWPHVEVPRIG